MQTLLGNDMLKSRLRAMLQSGHVFHSFLIAGPKGSGKRTLAVWLAAALECAAPEKPCLRCESCRKALAGTHPDILTVDSEKQILPVDLVRQACADAWVRPTEGPRRIILIPRGGDLNAQGQNALLKTLEEPPDHCVFLLLTENESALLPTVRSRCALLHLSPLPEDVLLQALKDRAPASTPEQRQAAVERSGGYLGPALTRLETPEDTLAETLVGAFAAKDALQALNAASALESLKRDQLAAVLEELLVLLTAALKALAGNTASGPAKALAASRTQREIAQAMDGIQTLLQWARSNVSPAHLSGALAVLLYRPAAFALDT